MKKDERLQPGKWEANNFVRPLTRIIHDRVEQAFRPALKS